MYSSFRRPLILLALLLAHKSHTVAQETCQEDGTCGASSPDEPKCGNAAHCYSLLNSNKTTSIYQRPGSGSAQAYKPNAPMKSTVCEIDNSRKKRIPYKIASWPFSKSTRTSSNKKQGAPVLKVEVKLWSCKMAEEEKGVWRNRPSECCCEPLLPTKTKVEVWQARPDGSYSSLSISRMKNQEEEEEGDCRATLPPPSSGKPYHFTTLAPGSTGSLGGLGPNGIDFPPYGPPVLHFLVTSDGHDPFLAEVPIVMNRDLSQRSFWGPDMRGSSMSSTGGRRHKDKQSFRLSSWSVDVSEKHTVNLQLDLYLQVGTRPETLEEALCPSMLYGLPKSFFAEPIAVCAPSLLDFFPL